MPQTTIDNKYAIDQTVYYVEASRFVKARILSFDFKGGKD